MPRQKKRPIERQPRLTTHGHRLAGRPADEVPQADHWRTTRRRAAARAGALHQMPRVLATGMCRIELLALHWQDIDLDAASLTVNLSLEYTRKHGLRFKAPKTKRGRRTITLPRISLTRASS